MIKPSTFSLNSCDKIHDFVRKHLYALNIDLYVVTKAYPNNTRFTLSSDPLFLNLYFDLKQYQYDWIGFPRALDEYKDTVSTWQYCHENHDSCKMLQEHQKEKQISLYLWLYFKYENYCVSHTFGVSSQFENVDTQGTDRELTMLTSNKDLLLRFIQNFYSHHYDIMLTAEKHKYHVPKTSFTKIEEEYDSYWGKYYQAREDFKALNKPDLIYLSGPLEGVYLTREEAEMVYLYYHGKPYVELAKKYQLSVRTIELRFSKLKEKLNVKTKLDLFRSLINNDIIKRIEVCL